MILFCYQLQLDHASEHRHRALIYINKSTPIFAIDKIKYIIYRLVLCCICTIKTRLRVACANQFEWKLITTWVIHFRLDWLLFPVFMMLNVVMVKYPTANMRITYTHLPQSMYMCVCTLKMTVHNCRLKKFTNIYMGTQIYILNM